MCFTVFTKILNSSGKMTHIVHRTEAKHIQCFLTYIPTLYFKRGYKVKKLVLGFLDQKTRKLHTLASMQGMEIKFR